MLRTLEEIARSTRPPISSSLSRSSFSSASYVLSVWIGVISRSYPNLPVT